MSNIIREDRENRENRTIKTIKTIKKKINLLSEWCSSGAITANNLLLEGVRLGLSQKKTPRDSTQTYSPRGLTFSDGPRMTPYHNKWLSYRDSNSE